MKRQIIHICICTLTIQKIFFYLRILKESENISDCDLEVYINHLDKLREDIWIHFGEIDNMHVPEWFVTQFDIKIYNGGHESDLEMNLLYGPRN